MSGRDISNTVRGHNNFEIYAMNADGGGQRNLTRQPKAQTDATWSPNGTQIAYTHIQDGRGQIYVMNANGSEQWAVTPRSRDFHCPAWSPSP